MSDTGRLGTVELQVCAGCGAAYFPRRLICRHCGSSRFEARATSEGVVEQLTVVRSAVGGVDAPRTIVTVRVDCDVRLIAGVRGSARPGDRVALAAEGGAVWATPSVDPA